VKPDGDDEKWAAQLEVVWILNGKRAPGRIAIGVPELVPDGGGEAICPVALDGLQTVTRVHGQGAFHAHLQAVRSLETQLRNVVAKGARVVLPEYAGQGEAEDPEHDTEFLLEMFKGG
jgi:hypothetical protein